MFINFKNLYNILETNRYSFFKIIFFFIKIDKIRKN